MLFRWSALVLFASLAASSAETRQEWGTSGDWTIFVDTANGNGCLMEKTFEDETLVQIGIVPNRQGGFLAAYNPAWDDIEEGADGVVRIDFGDTLFEGAVEGVVTNGLRGGYAFFDNPEFVEEFSKRNALTLTSKKSGHRVDIDLTGTSKATQAVRACQKEQPSG